MKVYQARVLSTLSYGSETWLTYSVKGRRLNCVYQRHLRTIMNVTLKDHVSNHDILAKGKIPSLPAVISQKRLWHWVMSLEWKTVGSLWKLCLGSWPHWQTSTPIQECLQTWHESLWHRDSHHPGETAEHNRTTWTKITCDGMEKNDEKHQHKWQKWDQPPHQPPSDPALKYNNCREICG